MMQRPCFWLKAAFLAGCFAALPFSGQSQTPAAAPQEAPVLKVNARAVVIDVVVTDKDGKPVQGLKQDIFSVAEDGHPQKLSSFEEHTARQSDPVQLPDVAPNVFTNVPRVRLSDAVTVLLLDSMNTALSDQQTVRQQMFKYLKNPVKGRRMAIFTLGATLRLVQGFSDDPEVLDAAMKSLKSGSGPAMSDLLPSSAGDALQSTAVGQILGDQATIPDPTGQAAAAALAQFFGEQNAAQNDLRVDLTLDAFQQLALYLAGIPGRKNVVWFSSAFPLGITPNPGNNAFAGERDYGEKIRKTDALLTAARVAVYPIAAEGVVADNDVTVQAPTNITVGAAGLSQQPAAMSNPQIPVNSNGSHLAMDEIAKDTGGHAIYNDNGLSEALTEVAENGSDFYTLSYIPSNSDSNGQFRKIQVKLAGSGYKLEYRRGYFATDKKEEKAAAAKAPTDPLGRFMGAGMPDSTEIAVALRVQPVSDQKPAAAQPASVGPAGDNTSKLKGPLTRYAVDFLLTTSGPQFVVSPDGSRHGKVRAELVAYDRGGRALNWSAREVPMDMDAVRFAAVEKTGIHFRIEVDVPKDGFSLRGGVYDAESRKAGTLEVPLSKVVVPAHVASSGTR